MIPPEPVDTIGGAGTARGSAMPSGRVPALDGVRGLAILIVMVCHFVSVPWRDSTLVGRLLTGGWIGVDLFFVLSGYLITGILVDARGKSGYYGHFFRNRVLRIFPLYFVTLILVYGITAIIEGGLARFTGYNSPWWFFGYASNIAAALKGGWPLSPDWFQLGHFWSLAVEEQFYLVWPFVVRLLPLRVLLWILGGVIVLGTPLRMHAAQIFGPATADVPAVRVLTHCNLDALALGGLLAVRARLFAPPGLWEFRITRIVWVMAGAATIFVVGIGDLVWRGSVTAVFFGATVHLASRENAFGPLRIFFENRFLRHLGDYSYGLYVFHLLLMPIWRGTFDAMGLDAALGPLGGAIAFFVWASLGSYGLARASRALIEEPFLRLKHGGAPARTQSGAGGVPATRIPWSRRLLIPGLVVLFLGALSAGIVRLHHPPERVLIDDFDGPVTSILSGRLPLRWRSGHRDWGGAVTTLSRVDGMLRVSSRFEDPGMVSFILVEPWNAPSLRASRMLVIDAELVSEGSVDLEFLAFPGYRERSLGKCHVRHGSGPVTCLFPVTPEAATYDAMRQFAIKILPLDGRAPMDTTMLLDRFGIVNRLDGEDPDSGRRAWGWSFRDDIDPWQVDASVPPSLCPSTRLRMDWWEGSPQPGSLRVDVPFFGARQSVRVAVAPTMPADLRGQTLVARVRLDAGLGADVRSLGGAKLFVKSGSGYVLAEGEWVNLRPGRGWVRLYLPIDHPPGWVQEPSDAGTFDPSDIRLVGVSFETGSDPSATWLPGVIRVDTIELLEPIQ